MQQLLIMPDEVSALSRDMSTHVDENRVTSLILEAQDIDIKSAIGDALFIDLQENQYKYAELLDGGVYECKCGRFTFSGLRKALAYYSYARLVKQGDSNVTRFGFVVKESEHSHRPDYREKVAAYNDAFSVADTYMKECLRYLVHNRDKYPLYQGNGGMTANRTIYRVLGD